MEIHSPAFGHGGNIPTLYTCDGQDINPPLKFLSVPSNTVSLALVVDDPDAPGGTFDHWLVWNIDPQTIDIEEGKPPLEAETGLNGFGRKGYGGPCPPADHSAHRYFFRLYALTRRLDLSPYEANKSGLMKRINKHSLVMAELVGRYSRQ